MSSHYRFRPIEILLVEDSPSDANLIQISFKQAKIANNLRWVEDGETALDYLLQQGDYTNSPRPDLIVLDLNLPGMDGQEVLTSIKSDPTLKRIPVIVLTTSEDEEDILKSYELNANCYITKPIDIQQFMRMVQLLEEFWLAAVQLPSE
ncbi:MAG: response regulator [Coleofasciculus sp. D1-CHI-01]|uniref:response regulator n=1 Tax=Coleofasciculus sp. D1-CHI-01 TaxID=3068482 RepID=UPI0032F56768